MSEFLSLKIEDEKSSLAPHTKIVGQLGEDLAALYLKKNGYRLILSNFKVPIGRNSLGASVSGEIDLIALDKNVLCFIEVKTRSSDEYASPIAAVDLRKQRQITRTARIYRKVFQLGAMKTRFDVVSIVLNKDAQPKIELFKNFWHESKFRKKSWSNDL